MPAACSSYWPMSEDLEQRIRAEATLEPNIAEDDKVRAVAEQAAEGDMPRPEDFDLPEQAALGDYVRIALERNPRVQARVRDVESLGMRVPQVTSLDDPMLSLMPPTASMIQTAAGEMDGSVGLSQGIPWPGKLAAKGRIAEQTVRIALESLQAERLMVVANVKKAYYSYYLSAATIQVTREMETLLQRQRDVAQAKYEAGITTQQDLLRAEVELYALSNALITFEQDRRTAIAYLNILMDRHVTSGLPEPPAVDIRAFRWRLEALMDRAVAQNPELKALQEGVRRNLEEIELAELQYFPDLSLGGLYTFITGGISPVATGRDAWSLDFGVSLPIWRHRLRAGVLERNAEAMATALRYRSTRNELFFAIQDTVVKVDAGYRSAVLFRDGILPRAQQTVEVSEVGYEAGDVDFTTWIENWRRLLALRLEYYGVLAGLESDFAELERITGGRLEREEP